MNKESIHKIIGDSSPTQELKRLINLVAVSDGAVVVRGPTGSGKELVAEALHAGSKRTGEFVAINCAAIPKDLLESELFGYEKGSFTGALKNRAGRFEQADNGTLFLDEIGDMSLDLQSKLLRVLETQKVQRIGSNKDIKVNVRIVCATHKDLSLMAEKSEFRPDLLYRLNVFPINVPALEDRPDDIPALVDKFLKTELANIPKENAPRFSEDALDQLKLHNWPGNVRELKNIVIRASILFPGIQITQEHVVDNLLSLNVPKEVLTTENNDLTEDFEDIRRIIDETSGPESIPPEPERFKYWFDHYASANLRGMLAEIEIVLIEAALQSEDGHIARAAKKLKLNRTTLIEKIKKYSIH